MLKQRVRYVCGCARVFGHDNNALLPYINYHELCARALLEAKADPNKAIDQEGQNKGFTALMWAAQFGHDLCARVLLEAGAAVNHAAVNGATALILSASNGQENCVQLLLDAGADREKEAPGHGNALKLAEKGGHTAICNLLKM